MIYWYNKNIWQNLPHTCPLHAWLDTWEDSRECNSMELSLAPEKKETLLFPFAAIDAFREA